MKHTMMLLSFGLMLIACVGCAENDYAVRTTTLGNIAVARIQAQAQVDAAKYAAIGAVTNGGKATQEGNETAKVVALMTMALMNAQAHVSTPVSDAALLPPPPKPAWDYVRDVLDLGLRGFSIWANLDLGRINSNNNREVSIATTNGFVAMGGQNRGNTSIITDSHNSLVDTRTVETTDRHDSIFNSYNPNTNNSVNIPTTTTTTTPGP